MNLHTKTKADEPIRNQNNERTRAGAELRKTREPRAARTAGEPLRIRLAEKLRSLIVNGTYKPGDRMIERELCERTKVSRPSLREALRQLETEGLIDILPYRGPVVRMVSEADVMELREILLALSTLIARRFAIHGTEEQINELEKAILSFGAALKSRERAVIKATKSALFDAFAAGANSEVAANYFQQINARLSFQWAASLDFPGRPEESIAELLTLLAAIRNRNPASAEAAMILHHEHGTAIAMYAQRVFEESQRAHKDEKRGKRRMGTR